MPTLERLTPEQFRQQLAGLRDERGSAAFSIDAFREHATNLGVALALVFNRKSLNPVTLWTRIDSAIQTGITAANGADIHALINTACEHVMASPNAVLSAEFGGLIGPILDMEDDEAYAFIRHLARSRYTLIAFTRKAWTDRKDLIAAAARIDKELETEVAA
jgi:hypothetical protein